MGRYLSLAREENPNYQYPEDMKLILDYLNSHGEVKVPGKKIEELWADFSDKEYCAGWLGVDTLSDNERLLSEFAEWLDKKG